VSNTPDSREAPRAATSPSTSSGRIGIFRRIAVERYMRPLESDTPEMLTPLNRPLAGAGVLLLAMAMVLLWNL